MRGGGGGGAEKEIGQYHVSLLLSSSQSSHHLPPSSHLILHSEFPTLSIKGSLEILRDGLVFQPHFNSSLCYVQKHA